MKHTLIILFLSHSLLSSEDFSPIEYTYGTHEKQKIDLYLGNSDKVLVWIHGGGWLFGDKRAKRWIRRFHNHFIDHQDLNIAPIGIDLASLLFDHDFSFDDKFIDAALSKHIGMNALNFTSEELKTSTLVALAHRSMRIVGTFICYFEDGHLLNRKKDIDKFLNRIVYSLDELNYSQQSKLIKRLL